MSEDTAGRLAPEAWCFQCQRPARAHGPRRRHWRVCGPLTGTAIGPFGNGADIEAYIAAMDGETR